MGFCPKCGYEYKPGFIMCSDCGVELVDELPVENNETSEITADFFMLRIVTASQRSIQETSEAPPMWILWREPRITGPELLYCSL